MSSSKENNIQIRLVTCQEVIMIKKMLQIPRLLITLFLSRELLKGLYISKWHFEDGIFPEEINIKICIQKEAIMNSFQKK